MIVRYTYHIDSVAYLVPRKKSSTLTAIGRDVATTCVSPNVRMVAGADFVVYSTTMFTFCEI